MAQAQQLLQSQAMRGEKRGSRASRIEAGSQTRLDFRSTPKSNHEEKDSLEERWVRATRICDRPEPLEPETRHEIVEEASNGNTATLIESLEMDADDEEMDPQVMLRKLDSFLSQQASETREQEARDAAESKTRTGKAGALVDKLQQAINSNDLAINSALYQKFNRELTTKDKAKYKACSSDKERSAWRIEWAKRELEEMEACKQHIKEWKRVDETRGQYFTCDRIAVEYGFAVSPVRAVRSAGNYCRRAALLGGKWMRWCELSEQWLFLFLSQEFREQLNESWQMFEVSTAQVKAPL